MAIPHLEMDGNEHDERDVYLRNGPLCTRLVFRFA